MECWCVLLKESYDFFTFCINGPGAIKGGSNRVPGMDDEAWNRDFRIQFPAAVALPIGAAVAHSLICLLDGGYLILAITYIPANLVIAAVRTAIHVYADPRRGPMLYANFWAGIHVLGAVQGLLTSVGLATMEAVPVGDSVIVGCFAAIWAVCCTVEGPVLKLPVGHRLLGHASVVVRCAASSLPSQPSQSRSG